MTQANGGLVQAEIPISAIAPGMQIFTAAARGSSKTWQTVETVDLSVPTSPVVRVEGFPWVGIHFGRLPKTTVKATPEQLEVVAANRPAWMDRSYEQIGDRKPMRVPGRALEAGMLVELDHRSEYGSAIVKIADIHGQQSRWVQIDLDGEPDRRLELGPNDLVDAFLTEQQIEQLAADHQLAAERSGRHPFEVAGELVLERSLLQ